MLACPALPHYQLGQASERPNFSTCVSLLVYRIEGLSIKCALAFTMFSIEVFSYFVFSHDE